MRRLLELDVPFMERYFQWLTGLFRGDFGTNREGQDVWTLLSQAMGTTFRLIIIATIASILIGLVIGIITAVRQYSALDYASTFAAFLFFSLPVFWLAVMLKEFGAIKFNNYLEQPGFSIAGIVIISVLTGLIAAGVTGGTKQRRLIAFGAVAAFCAVVMWILDATDWMLNPGSVVAGRHRAVDRGRCARGDGVRSVQHPARCRSPGWPRPASPSCSRSCSIHGSTT